jgi:hypothetical protein
MVIRDGFVTLPEVVTGELAGKFGEISLFDHHADFELESASNSNSTSPWAIACEPATQPSHAVPPPREHASPSLVNTLNSSSRGEHHLPGCFSLERTLQHRRPHAGEPRAAPFWCRPPW